MVAWRVVRLRFFVLPSLAFAHSLALSACVPEERPKGSRAAAGHPATTTGPAQLADGRQAAPDPKLSERFTDGFDRGDTGSDWNITGSGWALKDGRLCVSGAHNHPAWLRRRLPVNARIEFEATSSSPEGDLKAEAWGDGSSAATGTSYRDATSYIVIFGGWKNTMHVLARLDEHATARTELRVEPGETNPRAQPVLPDRAYRFKIERTDGQTVRYFVDDVEILSLKDPHPLTGEGHEHFGFNDWQVPACFDNLTITPLKS
ncbi:MAG TPA: hypothetical protein VF294_03085 [Polyangiaceae bacterium]